MACPPKGGHYVRIATVLGTIAFAVLPAWTLEKPLVPVHLEEVDGMYYGDEGTADGRPFHWTREYASFFVPNKARTVDVPLRSAIAALTKEPTLVEITSGGKTLINALVDDKWSTVRLTLPSPEPPLLFSRINLKVNHTAKVAENTGNVSDCDDLRAVEETTPGRTRTCDRRFRKPLLYPPELQPRAYHFNTGAEGRQGSLVDRLP